jgi:hypothetical protein
VTSRAPRLAVAALILSLAGCGGGGGSPAAPPPPQRTLVAQGSQADIPPVTEGVAFFVIVQIPVTGTLEATVDWMSPSNPVALAWGQGECLDVPDCTLLTQNTTSAKPKTVTAPNLAPGTYTLAVLNLGTTNESVSYQIFFTR